MSDFASLVAGAISMVAEPLSIVQATPGEEGTYTPATGRVTGRQETPYAVQGVVTTYNARDVDGSTIQSGDLQCELIAMGLTFTPKAGDTLLRGTTRLEIVQVTARPVKGQIVTYHLQVRGNG
jgi:hypothetical protein